MGDEYINDYGSALSAAGAEILAFEEFGSYQGDWIAKIKYQGEIRWVAGSYGSCTGCDAFMDEFGYETPSQQKLAAFGKQYLEEFQSYDQLLRNFKKQSSWDYDTKKVISFLEQNK